MGGEFRRAGAREWNGPGLVDGLVLVRGEIEVSLYQHLAGPSVRSHISFDDHRAWKMKLHPVEL